MLPGMQVRLLLCSLCDIAKVSKNLSAVLVFVSACDDGSIVSCYAVGMQRPDIACSSAKPGRISNRCAHSLLCGP